MDGWMDGCMGGWVDGWMDGWMDGSDVQEEVHMNIPRFYTYHIPTLAGWRVEPTISLQILIVHSIMMCSLISA